jgi:hypothetical protein
VGQLTVLELKLLIHLALEQLDDAQDLTQAFLQYNDNSVERGLFYQALNVVLEVTLDDDLELAITKPISAACLATSVWMRQSDRSMAACALRLNADEHEAGRA